MKAQLFGNTKRGVSTLEILIAFAVLTLMLTASIVVVFSNQSVSIDTQTNDEALSKAESLLESTRALSRQDFDSVVSTLPTPSDIYKENIDVTMPNPLDPNIKQVVSTVSWIEGGRTLSVHLTTLLTNSLVLGSSCSPVLSSADMDRWKNPQMKAWELVKDLIPAWPPSNNFIIEDVTPYKNHLYIVGGALQGSNNGSFLVVFKTTSDPTQNPVYLTGANIALTPTLAPAATSSLPQGVKVNGNYAYIASGRNFCTTKSDCGQLIVADISKVDTQALTSADLTYFKIPGVVGSGTQGIGKSIFYDKGVVYIGLTKTPAGGGPEFNVIDVGGGGLGGTPTNPKLMGSYSVGAGVSAIYVSGHFAYLTTDDQTSGKALLVMDLNDLSTPKWSNIFSTSFGFASAIAASVNPLYVGMTYNSTNPEFFILNNTDPVTQKPTFTGPGLSLSSTNGINSLLVKGVLAFLVTNNDFEIVNVSNPNSISQWSSPIPYDGGGSGTAAGCSGNIVYVGSRPSAADKAHLAVFYPAKIDQTINISTHAPASAGYNSNFSVAALASSGLSVAVTVTGSCSISGNTITITNGSGSCTVLYNQSGNYNYNAAPQISETVAAGKSDQTITFVALADKTLGDPDFTVVASASSGLTVSFASQTTGVCTVSGSTVHLVAAGSCTIRASQAGDANYNAAATVDQSFTVQKAPSTTTVSCPLSVTYNGSALTPCTVSVTGAGGLSLTPAATYSNNVNAGTASASYTYAGDPSHTGSSDSKNFTINKATPTISWSNPASITYGTALSGTQLNANSGGVAGAFTYTPPAGTVLNAGTNQTLSVHFVPTDSTNYNTPSDKTVFITVNKATPSISTSIVPAPPVTAGTTIHAKSTLSGNPPPTGTVTFVLFKNGNCSGGSGQQALTSSGTLSAGVAVSSNFTTTTSNRGSMSYLVSYPGDVNDNAVSPGQCTAFTVI